MSLSSLHGYKTSSVSVYLSPAPKGAGEAVPKTTRSLSQTHPSRRRTFLAPPSARWLVRAVSSLVKGRIHSEISRGSQEQHPDLPRKVSHAPRRCFGTCIPWTTEGATSGGMLGHLLQPRELSAEEQTPWAPGLTESLSRRPRGPLLDGNQAPKGKGWVL